MLFVLSPSDDERSEYNAAVKLFAGCSSSIKEGVLCTNRLSCFWLRSYLISVSACAEDRIVMTSLTTGCPDHFVEITNWAEEIEYRYYSMDEHKCYDIYIGICYNCQSVERVGLYRATFSHNWIYEDGGHLSNKLLHQRIKLCPVCEYSYVELLNCPGPQNGGCMVTLNKINHQEE